MNEGPGHLPDDPRFEHSYDGIEEYDNPMPRWWVLIFWATIAYSVLYLVNVVPRIGEGKGRIAQYEADVAKAEKLYAPLRAQAGPPTEAALVALARDGSKKAAAQKAFTMNCAACHGEDGGGVIGPNLTDAYWIHGGRPQDVWKTVNGGVLDKGMPAWGKVLPPDQVALLAAHVLDLRGTHPKNPKAPQGEEFHDDDDGANHAEESD
jgi:cytochrome c oxidase cbb3-type subunit 3